MPGLLEIIPAARIRCTGFGRQRFVASRLLLVFCVAVPIGVRAEWFGDRVDMMGTSVSVELWHADADRGRELVAQVLTEYRRIDELMSTYKPDSEISRLNARGSIEPVTVGAELFSLIERSLELSERSGGAFDISYESVGYLYDFRARQRPTDAQIEAGLVAVDFRAIVLDASDLSVSFELPGMRINLGGIAKGYAVERGAALLRANGVEHALLNAGGDTRVIGDRRGQPWIVGIRHPRLADAVVTRLPVVEEAISTSGDYERFFDDNGRRYHHIINPVTGAPTEEMMSVTVIGPDATLTDGLSTTLFVLGNDLGLRLIEEFDDYEAVMVDRAGKLTFSSGLAAAQ